MFRNRDEFACALRALERRDFAAAATELTQLLERCADDADRAFLYNKRGVARIGLELRELAREDFDAALAARRHYAPALTNLGNLLLESGLVNEAIAQYQRAIASDVDYALAHLNLGMAYKKAGRVAEGVRAIRHAQRLEDRARPSALRSLRWFRRS